MIIGYTRVSKVEDQDTAARLQALINAGAERIFEETASGGRWDRPELHRAHRATQGNQLNASSLTRIAQKLAYST